MEICEHKYQNNDSFIRLADYLNCENIPNNKIGSDEQKTKDETSFSLEAPQTLILDEFTSSLDRKSSEYL